MSAWPEMQQELGRSRRPLVPLFFAAVVGLMIARHGGKALDGLILAAFGGGVLLILAGETVLRRRRLGANALARHARQKPDVVSAALFRLGLWAMIAGGFWAYLAAVEANQQFVQARFPTNRVVPVVAVGKVVEAPVPMSPLAGEFEGDADVPDVPSLTAVPPLLDDNEDYSQSPESFSPRAVFVLDVFEYRGGAEPLILSGSGGSERVRVFTDERWPNLHYGEVIEIPVGVDTPEGPGNVGEFDYRGFLRETGISRVAQWKFSHGARRLGELVGWDAVSPAAFASAVRQRLIFFVHSHLGEPHASLLLTLTVAARAGLDDDLRDSFRQTGTVHLLVISGLHIGFLVVLLEGAMVLLGVGFRARALAMIVLLIFFRELTGGQVAVTRAVCMGCFYFGARLYLRPTDFLNLLAGAALVVLLINPHDLFRSGFQLSFGAVFWLRFLGVPRTLAAVDEGIIRPPVVRFARWFGAWIWNGVRVSTACFLGLTPLLVHDFNIVTPSVIVTNLLTLPLMFGILACAVPLVVGMAIETAVGATGLFAGPLGIVVMVGAGGQAVLIWVVGWLAKLPASHVYVAAPNVAWVVTAEVALLGIAFRKRLGVPWRRIALAFGLLAVAMYLQMARESAPQAPVATLLDVDQGTCVVLETPSRAAVVVDPGTSAGWAVGRQIIAPFVWSRGISQIEAVILTHPQWDHCQGLDDLLDVMPVRRVIVSREFAADSAGMAYLEKPRAMGVPVLVVDVGDVFRIDGTEFRVLGPLREIGESAAEARNDRSLVVAWKAFAGENGGTAPARTNLLITGDIEETGTDALLRMVEQSAMRGETTRPVDAVVVPHHGRTNEMLPDLFAALKPRVALMGDRFPPQSHLRTAARGAAIFDTFKHGAIRVEFAADGGMIVRPYYASLSPRVFQASDVVSDDGGAADGAE